MSNLCRAQVSSHNGAICRKRVQRTKPALLTAKAFSRSPEKLDAALQFAFPRKATTHLNDSRSASTTRRSGKRTTTYRTQTIPYYSIFEKRTKERRYGAEKSVRQCRPMERRCALIY